MEDELGALGLLSGPLDAGLALEMLRSVIDPDARLVRVVGRG